MEQGSTGIDRTQEFELLLFCNRLLPEPETVSRSFGRKTFEFGQAIFKGGLVQKIKLQGNRLEGQVRSGEARHTAVWEVSPRGLLRLECTCPTHRYCEHQVALYLAAYSRRKDHSENLRQSALHVEATRPSLKLCLEKGIIRLYAELAAENGLRWPVCEETARQQINGRVVICDPLLLKALRERIFKAGFHAEGAPGHYRLSDPFQLDNFLSISLPSWKQEYHLDLDQELDSLLRAPETIRPRICLRSGPAVDWFEMSWRLQIGDQVLEKGDLQALKGFLGEFFRTRDGRVLSVNSAQIHRQLEELRRIGYSVENEQPQPVRLHQLHRVIALLPSRKRESGTPTMQIDPSLDSIYRCLVRRQKPPRAPLPDGLRNFLRDYQKEGVDFLHFLSSIGLNGILADDMGLGKTLQTLALLTVFKEQQGQKPSLVVCPTSVVHNWLEESSRFTPDLQVAYADSSVSLQALECSKFDVIILSYGLLFRNELKVPFRFVVLDEAQRIKNPRTRVARAAKSLNSEYRLALTGTPIENSVTEIWSIFDFLMPGFLGNFRQFERRFAKPIMKRNSRARLRQLTSQVRPFIMRRLKEEVASELPAKTEQDVYCELTAPQKALYRKVVAAVRSQIGREIADHGLDRCRISVLAALTRLRQLCCHPGLWSEEFAEAGSSKLKTLMHLVQSILAGGHRVVVFSQFVGLLKIVRNEMTGKGIPYLYLDGSTRNRSELIERFQRKEGQHLFLMSLKAGGTGITLTAADYVILYEPWWNPAVENQAIDRIHRIGQKKPVTAYRLIAAGTIEEKMMQLKDRKKVLADQLLQAEKEGLRQMTERDLQFLLSG